MKIAVIGAGIIGVSTAFLIKYTHPQTDVILLSKTFSPNTTSDGAAGFWEPFLPGDTPKEIIWRWCKETYDYVIALMKDEPSSGSAGLMTMHGFNLSADETVEVPYWSNIPFDFQVLPKDQLKRFPDYIKSGFSFTTVFIEGPKYIPWLSQRFCSLGGEIKQQEVTSLNELSESFDIVVNCCGLNAKELIGDNEVYPIRGQVAQVKAPWINEFFMFDSPGRKSTYILPNQDYVVLGGTMDPHDYNTEPNADDRKWILSSCQDLIPSLKQAEHIRDWVGLRPARNPMRVEKEELVTVNKKGVEKILKVVHNYGHGGSGLTVHWGCAMDALKLVGECMKDMNTLKGKL